MLRENFDMVSAMGGGRTSSRRDLASSNIVDLTNANQKLCDVVTIQLLGSAIEKVSKSSQDYQHLEQYTPIEKTALQVRCVSGPA